jgi:stage IV sporulation protein FB
VFAVLRIGGFRVPYFETAFGVHLPVGTGLPISNTLLCMFLFYLLYPSILWAIFNLAPVYPLDGGHISRELFLLLNPREGIRYSLTLSIATAGGIAIYSFSHHNTLMAVMMGWLGYSSYQILQAYMGNRFGGPGRSSW